MDDIYDDLDNFTNESTIDELKNENKDLKIKLQEHASSLESLQKDFDHLSSEYKKLELNYSSLLKTARAEIERKTKIISNLNVEKDNMMLKLREKQNFGGGKRCGVGGKSAQPQTTAKKSNKQTDTNKIETNDKIPPNLNKERNIEATNLTKDTANAPSELKNRLLNLAHSGDQRTTKIINENNKVDPPRVENHVQKVASIKNRRKSMLGASMETENFEENINIDVNAKTHSNKVRHIDNSSNKYSSKTSESSSMDDRGSECYDHSHTNDRSRQHRTDIDKYRKRDKSSHRSRRHSPDRYSRGHKDFQDEPYHRSDHDRGRVADIPLDEMQQRRRQSQEPRQSSYERGHPQVYTRKHKIDRSYDELNSKKMRTDPHHRHREGDPHYRHREEDARNRHRDDEARSRHREDETRKRHREDETRNRHRKDDTGLRRPEDEAFHRQRLEEERHRQRDEEARNRHRETEKRLQLDREFLEKNYFPGPHENVHFSSCESPDHSHPDLMPTQQIREIKLTATAQLDDPRTLTNKYVLQKKNGRVALSTVEGRNVNIIPINRIKWDTEPQTIPESLVNRPSLESDKISNEIYMDIENISKEPGEISDDMNSMSQNSSQEPIPISAVMETAKPEIDAVKRTEIKSNNHSSQNTKSYKIPKLKKTDNIQNVKSQPSPLEKLINENASKMKNNLESNLKKIGKNEKFTKVEKEKDTHVVQVNESPFLANNDLVQEKYATAKEIEDDLQLSDDTCDNNDSQKNFSAPTNVNNSLENSKKDHITSQIDGDTKRPNNALDALKSDENVDNSINHAVAENTITSVLNKEKGTDDSKKSKHKRKPKNKDSKDEHETNKQTCVTETVKTVKKKEKETKTKEIKNKFTELFGDSSSLISPEDLGLTPVPVSTTRLPDKCIPFFEDAVDLDEIKPIEVAASTEKSHPEEIVERAGTQEVLDKNIDTQKTSKEEPIESLYKNLLPSISEKEPDVVKTVIISTGVQPQLVSKDDKSENEQQTKPKITNLKNDVGLKALATSTPHKTCQLNVQDNVITKPDVCSDSMVSGVSHATLDNSDSNISESQSNATDVPDVRIFVRRKRKVIKK